jgi:hypothetical protein
MSYIEPEIVGGHERAKKPGDVDFENPPLVITFTPEQKKELKGTILEGVRGIRLLEEDGKLIAEQLA